MHLNCPNCGAPISAEHINVQQMVAVCAACDTVFQFDLPEAKAKRRKVKQPNSLLLHDTDEKLHMEFRTNFRLERNQTFLISLFAGIGLAILTSIQINQYVAGEGVLFLLILLPIVAILHFYRLALLVYNKTHIDMDDDRITVSRKPLPTFIVPPNEINLVGMVAIKYEETPISQKEGYDTPRYRVWAERMDGSRKMIVNDVIEDYAIFIAQSLDERLQLETESDTSRLEDREQEGEHTHTVEDLLQTTENS